MKYQLLVFILIGAGNLMGQDLYKPRNIAKAYEKGTRSPDGKPGKNYWQNHARYAISIEATPPQRKITGSETVVYKNNSPDSLISLTFKLILNIHKPGAIRESPASDNYLTSGIHIDRYMENGTLKKWEDPGSFTFKRVQLTKPLAPHDSISLAIDWHFDVSVESGREGAIDSTTFFLAYFYPRVAVYDDYNGWDRTNFTDAQEFYNDFNDYTFEVKVPANYIVWATGDLLNPGEVLQPAAATRLKESMTSDSVVHVATAADLRSKTITVQKQNTWKWRADHISDVTIAISNRYVWDAASVVVDNGTHRRAGVQASFDDSANDFHSMVKFSRHALDWLSNNWPGVPYPFQKTTVVQGYADMEYPMMVNDSHQDDPSFTKFIVEHEIAHSWFPFYMGINENRFGFMDEGWATAFELLIGRADVGNDRAEGLFKQFRVAGWINSPAAEQDIPIITPTSVLNGAAMGNNEYGKGALGYLAMKDLLGDAGFKKALHEFMRRWNGKHPLPWDMFNTFNDATGMDMNWFWRSWYFSSGYIDFSIRSVTTNASAATITIDNAGGYPAPVDISLVYADGTSDVVHQTPAIWKNNMSQAVVKVPAKKKLKSVLLDGGIFMDATPKNNAWDAH